MVLKKLADADGILEFMNEDSVLKEYCQRSEEHEFVNGVESVGNRENCIKLNYLYTEYGIEYVESASNIENEFMAKTWIKKFGHKNKRHLMIKVMYGNQENKINLEKIIACMKGVSRKFPAYQFFVRMEWYRENLLLSSGILENRKLDHVLLVISQNEKEIDSYVYTYMPSVDKIVANVECALKRYEDWIKLRLECEMRRRRMIWCFTTPEISARIFHEAIGHTAERDVFEKAGQNTIAINDKISNFQLNVWDIPRDKNIKTNSLFDDKGITAKQLQIIKNGMFIGIMSDECDTKNGYHKSGFVRNSIDNDELQIRMRNLIVQNGDENAKDIVSKFDEILFFEKAGCSYREGTEIYIEIVRGTLFEKGIRVKRIENMLIHCELKSLLSHIEHICDNAEWDEMKWCRKNGGKIYLSAYAPSIVCRIMI